MHRRKFLSGLAGAGAAASIAHALPASSQSGNEATTALPRATAAGTLRGEMLYRTLGSTGIEVSALGLGGSHVAKPGVEEAESIRLIQTALDRGLNFLDNSWDYNEGQSELRMGKALSQAGYRKKAFLMTKIDGRTKDVAARQIETSLERLQTDHIDLLQHHEVLRFDDPDRIFAEGGAMEAFVEAKKAGKIRFIGFTGHKDPRVHLYMLETAQKHGFHFDTVQMPLNVMDAHFRSFAQMVVPRALSDGIGILGMKSMGGGDAILLKSKTASAMECLHYSMNLPTSVVITGIDTQRALDQAFEAAKSFRLMNEQEVAAILDKTKQAAVAGKYELFKTTSHFDTTVKHPDWLGGDTPAVQKIAPMNAG